MYLAHSPRDDDPNKQGHLLQDHLIATGHTAAGFARAFGLKNRPLAVEQAVKLAGLLHDLGKYCQKFQARLAGATDPVDHAAAGAKEIATMAQRGSNDYFMAQLIAYAIAGHHAGLADYQPLEHRLKKPIEPIDPIWRTEIPIPDGPLWPGNFIGSTNGKAEIGFQLAFLGRMVFSCLVDADFKDTELFYKPGLDRRWPDLGDEIDGLIAKFEAEIARKTAKKSDLNTCRTEILAHVRARASAPPGLFTLTVPTGGGKTLASLGFALDHAKAHGHRRIIYAIPFTAIIDQTAAIFRSVLGDAYVLEHHAALEEKRFCDREQGDKLKLAMEDWAAPVVVTTNVQLFESLFANRPARCRKLHNIANSIIILDEAQTLPLDLLRPCLAALDELARNYGATIVLCTATQPALDRRDLKQGGLALQGRELAPDPADLARRLRRVEITHGHTLSDDDLVAALRAHPQALVIVNSRAHALALYRRAEQEGLDGIIHLTTRQYAAHRRTILERVRVNLNDKAPCRLIATSLIECGVDVDFPRVWRAEAGLDQIAQAAGRCNRENRRPRSESIVTVFKTPDHRAPPDLDKAAAAFARVAGKHADLLSPDAIKDYFKDVYWQKSADQLDHKKILAQHEMSGGTLYFNYQTVATDFRMIESGLTPVIINDHPTVAEILGRLNERNASPAKAARDLQPYLVQVTAKAFQSLRDNEHVAYHRPDLWGDQFAVLKSGSKLYAPEIGLQWERADQLESFIY